MKAYIFPGQGSQFPGMGKDIFENSPKAKELFLSANDILGFDLVKIMFEGTEEELKQTKVTQPAIFLHSVALALSNSSFAPEMVAGHSLGEFSALVSAGALKFDDGLKLVYKRALAMQAACEKSASTMAAILGLDDAIVEKICAEVTLETNEPVIAANYNCPGQLVISGAVKSVEIACEKLKAAGAKRALLLPVSGGFHSPYMDPAKIELAAAINSTTFNTPICPVYQNVDALPYTEVEKIRENLIAQLTAPVKWTQSVNQMISDGASIFIESGPGKVLQGLVKKINKEAEVASI